MTSDGFTAELLRVLEPELICSVCRHHYVDHNTTAVCKCGCISYAGPPPVDEEPIPFDEPRAREGPG